MSADARTPARGCRSSRAGLALLVASTLAVWVTRCRVPRPSAAPVLDPSYQQALGVALERGMQFGPEILYTHGPLGWFNAQPFQPGLYWVACFGWGLVAQMVMAALLAATMLRSGGSATRVAAAIVILVVLPATGHDAGAFAVVVAAAGFAIPRSSGSAGRAAPALLVLALLALVKFTYTLLALVAVACTVVSAARSGRARAARIAGLFLALLFAAWWIAGQSPWNLPGWLAATFELSAAYGTAMSRAAPPGEIALAVAVLAAGGVMVVLATRGAEDRRSARALACVWIAASLLAFKVGFSRALGSQQTFFGFASAAPFLVAAPAAVSHRMLRAFRIARASAVVLALAGLGLVALDQDRGPFDGLRAAGRNLVANAEAATDLVSHRRALEEERRELAATYALPRVREAVGDATVDVFGSEQAFVFLNDLAWHPRPLFQAFCVLTDDESRVNARFLAGRDAPRFLLHCPDAIDGRLPGMEDARSLQVMLRDYAPVLAERGMMLFERRADAPRPDPREVVLERTIVPGETLEMDGLPGDVLLLEVRAGLDVLGRLQTLVAGAPPLLVESESDDGLRETTRVVPEMMLGGAVVRPWLRDPDTWVRFATGRRSRSIARLRFVDPSGRWSTPFTVRVVRADALRPEVDPAREAGLRWSTFDPAPVRVESPSDPAHVLLRGYRDVLVVDAPSRIVFAPGPGAWRLTAEFGFEPSAWRGGPTDGAIVRVERRRGDGMQVLFERALDPVRVPADGKLQSLDLALDLEPGDEIDLATDPGPAGDARRDRVFWNQVAFRREP